MCIELAPTFAKGYSRKGAVQFFLKDYNKARRKHFLLFILSSQLFFYYYYHYYIIIINIIIITIITVIINHLESDMRAAWCGAVRCAQLQPPELLPAQHSCSRSAPGPSRVMV